MNLTLTGRLIDCVRLSWRVPAVAVAPLLPPGLELATRGPWAFWSVLLGAVEGLRPDGEPEAPRTVSRHVLYRLHAQAMDDGAELLRGLYVVRWDASDGAEAVSGRVTGLRPQRAAIAIEASDAAASCVVSGTPRGEGDGAVRVEAGDASRPPDSCFPSLLDARDALAEPPVTLGVEGDRLTLARLRGDAAAWRETPVRVTEARLPFLDTLGGQGHVLELATRVAPVDLRWELGESRRLLGGEPLQHDGVPRHAPAPRPERVHA